MSLPFDRLPGKTDLPLPSDEISDLYSENQRSKTAEHTDRFAFCENNQKTEIIEENQS